VSKFSGHSEKAGQDSAKHFQAAQNKEMNLPDNPLKSFQARNPHLYPSWKQMQTKPGALALKAQHLGGAPGVRIRQDSKPLMNKLENSWFTRLVAIGKVKNLSAQSLRFKLANGAWYKTDMAGWIDGRLTCWECKGPACMKNVARGILTVKCAAALWPEIDFILIWRVRGVFHQQKVLP
jgi:hypothetical protein